MAAPDKVVIVEDYSHRPPGMVQVPIARRTFHENSHIVERTLLTLGLFALFSFIGYWVITQWHVISFTALDQLNRALMVWHNDPGTLAAIGTD
jgi:hypothetical protein